MYRPYRNQRQAVGPFGSLIFLGIFKIFHTQLEVWEKNARREGSARPTLLYPTEILDQGYTSSIVPNFFWVIAVVWDYFFFA